MSDADVPKESNDYDYVIEDDAGSDSESENEDNALPDTEDKTNNKGKENKRI